MTPSSAAAFLIIEDQVVHVGASQEISASQRALPSSDDDQIVDFSHSSRICLLDNIFLLAKKKLLPRELKLELPPRDQLLLQKPVRNLTRTRLWPPQWPTQNYCRQP